MSPSACLGEKKNLLPLLGIEMWSVCRPYRSLLTIPTVRKLRYTSPRMNPCEWTINYTSYFAQRELLFILKILFYGGGVTWGRSWLRQCVTSRKVAGSIPKSVIVIFRWYNPSGRTMAQWLTQPLTEMSKSKGKEIPLQAWTGPEGSRRLRFPDFKTTGTWMW